jgi:hypothetical protein
VGKVIRTPVRRTQTIAARSPSSCPRVAARRASPVALAATGPFSRPWSDLYNWNELVGFQDHASPTGWRTPRSAAAALAITPGTSIPARGCPIRFGGRLLLITTL